MQLGMRTIMRTAVPNNNYHLFSADCMPGTLLRILNGSFSLNTIIIGISHKEIHAQRSKASCPTSHN